MYRDFFTTPDGSVIDKGVISDSPTGTITITDTGFALTFQNRAVAFNTSYSAVVRSYTGCSRCVGLGIGRDSIVLKLSGAASDLSYTTYGNWQTQEGQLIEGPKGVFAMGTLTAVGDRPTLGTAHYAGKASGFATTPGLQRYALDGNIALTADFGANVITGGVNNIAAQRFYPSADYYPIGSAGIANDITLSGTIAGVGFSGTARTIDVVPGTGNVTVNLSGLAGTFGGAFYGPGASEVGGSLALSGTVSNIIMSFGAKE